MRLIHGTSNFRLFSKLAPFQQFKNPLIIPKRVSFVAVFLLLVEILNITGSKEIVAHGCNVLVELISNPFLENDLNYIKVIKSAAKKYFNGSIPSCIACTINLT